MPTDWPELLAAGATTVRAIVPELQRVPLYLVDQKETAFVEARPMAMTSPRLDLMLKDHVGERWAGRGIAVLFNTPLIEACYLDVQAWIRPAIVHEVSHALADGWGLQRHLESDDYPGDQVAALVGTVVEHTSRSTWWEDEGGITCLEFLAHDDRWLRCCCHLATRAGLPVFDVIGHREELSSPIAYLFTLREEIYRSLRRPVAEILNSPAPEAFAELWALDVVNFESARRAKALAAHLSQSPKGEERSMSSMLEKVVRAVTGKLRQKEKTAAERFRALALQLANDEEPAEKDVLAILEAAGKTPTDLEEGVNWLIERRRLRQQLDRGQGIAGERAQLEQQFAALKETFEKAAQTFETKGEKIRGAWRSWRHCNGWLTTRPAGSPSSRATKRFAPSCARLAEERRQLATRLAKLRHEKKAGLRKINDLEIAAGKAPEEGVFQSPNQRDPEQWLAGKFSRAAQPEKEARSQTDAAIEQAVTAIGQLQAQEEAIRGKMTLAAV